MKLSLIRGAFTNPFELQNYYPLKSKYDIRVISSKHPVSDDIDLPLTKLLSPTDLPNFPFKLPILNRLFTDAHYLVGLEKEIAGSDIVHVAETYYHYTLQAIKAKQAGLVKKVISTVWEVIPFNNEGIRGRKQFKRLSYKHIDHFIAVTEKAKSALIKEGVGESKITVIPMGIDLSRFHQKILNPKSSILNILYVGRLVPEKGVGDLIAAFRCLRFENKNLNLTLVGDGPLKKIIKVGEGIMVKPLPYSKIPKVYSRADIFCLPSKTTPFWQEQYGMVLLEAMAAGLPIVTTDTGAIGEVCGDSALYALPDNPEDLQSKLSAILYNKALSAKYSSKAYKRAIKFFDRNKVAEKLNALYQQILCPSKKP